METKRFKGTPDVQKMAAWITNLMMQRGFSFASDSTIELGQAELVEYFASQPGQPKDHDDLVALMEEAVETSAGLLHRRASAEDVTYWAIKRELEQFLHAPATAALPKQEKAPAPSPARSQDAKPPKRETPAEREKEKPADEGELPITQQYQIAVLKALHQLGGRGKAAHVIDMIPQVMELPSEHQGTYARGPEGKSEEPKYVKFVHSARRFLIQQGEVESPDRGIWAITERGEARLKSAGRSG